MLLTADLGFGVLTEYARRFPRQYLNVGVAEQNLMGLAVGLALEGRTVFAYSIGNFPTLRCLEQLRNDACYHLANVKVVSVGAGLGYGALGMSHHATEDVSICRTLPNITVVSPGDAWEAHEATLALAAHPGPALLRLGKSAALTANLPGEQFELGKARMLRDGPDVTLVASGSILAEVLRAADGLAQRGIFCRVLSMHTVKPLDVGALVAAARETGGIITVEEHTVEGGLGGAVAEGLLELGQVPKVFHRIALREPFPSVVGSQEYLRTIYGISAGDVVETVEARLRSRRLGAHV
jgi:transketolase